MLKINKIMKLLIKNSSLILKILIIIYIITLLFLMHPTTEFLQKIFFVKFCGTGLFRNNQIIRTIQKRCVFHWNSANLNLSARSRKSLIFQFDYFGKLNFPDHKTPSQSQLYQNNLSIRINLDKKIHPDRRYPVSS